MRLDGVSLLFSDYLIYPLASECAPADGLWLLHKNTFKAELGRRSTLTAQESPFKRTSRYTVRPGTGQGSCIIE